MATDAISTKVVGTTTTTIQPQIKEALKVGFWGRAAAAKSLSEISADELQTSLEALFVELIEAGVDPLQAVDQLAPLLPPTDLETRVSQAKDLLNEARLYLATVDHTFSPTAKAHLEFILERLVGFLEALMAAFGVGDVFSPSTGEMHAMMKSQKMMMLISLVAMLMSMLIPVAGVRTAGLGIGGAFLTLSVISVLWPRIKPMPYYLPNAKNWTKEAQEGKFEATAGRQGALDRMAQIFQMGSHPILVGPSRVGKNLTAEAFTRAIERGEYPHLKGKKVFYINGADIIGHAASFIGGGNKILEEISEAMGRHRDDIVLVIDEVHMVCKDDKMADQLKPLLDTGGGFPYVIGITTDREYEEHVVNNHAFANRFVKVEIQSMNRDETIATLSRALLQSRSQPLVDEGDTARIYEQSANEPQPFTALRILNQKLTSMEGGISPKAKELREVSEKIEALYFACAACRGRVDAGIREQIQALEARRVQLQAAADEEREAVNKLEQAKRSLAEVTRQMYRTVCKVAQAATSVQVTRLHLLQMVGPLVERRMRALSQQLGISVTLKPL